MHNLIEIDNPPSHGALEGVATGPRVHAMPSFLPLTEREYDAAGAWGMSTTIDLYDCDPDLIRDAQAIQEFTIEMCDLIGVRRFGPARIVRFGRDPSVYGYSMVQLIETSLVSGHFAETTNAVYLDVFSCKFYDAAVAVEYAARFFKAARSEVRVTLRH